MKRCLSFLSTLLFLSAPAYGIELKEALVKVYKHHPTLASARANLKAEDERAAEAFSGWLPVVQASASYGRQENSFGNNKAYVDAENRSINVTQPLFRGGKTFFSMRHAKALILAERGRLLASEQQIFLETITAYVDIVRDEKLLSLAKHNHKVMKEHLKITKEEFQLGKKTRTDIAQAKASSAAALSDKIRAKGVLSNTQARFHSLVSLEPTNITLPKDNYKNIQDKETLLKTALAQHPDIIAARHTQQAAAQQIGVKASSLFPTLDLSGSSSEQTGNVFSGDSKIKTNAIALNLAVPLYQSGAEYAGIRKARKQKEKSNYDLGTVERDVKEKVIEAFNNYNTIKSAIDAQKSAVTANQAALEGTREEAKIGARTTLDVLEAEQELFESRANLVSLKRDLVVAYYTIEATTGNLTAEKLALDVTFYDPKTHYNKVKHKVIGW